MIMEKGFDDISGHILIVEDSPTQALRLQLFLEDNGFQTEVAEDGCDALKCLEKNVPAVVISDVEMPNMNGYELCHTIKNSRTLNRIPIMLLTSQGEPGDIIKGLNCQANYFLLKPFEEQTLLARVRYLISMAKLSPASISSLNLNVSFAGKRYAINSDRIQILEVLLNSYDKFSLKYDDLVQENKELKKKLTEAGSGVANV